MNILPVLLLVEDEPLIRGSLADVLTDVGYFPLEAEDGAEAMSFFDVCKTVVGVITDIRLGSGANGWEVARHARRRFQNIPVVYIMGDDAANGPLRAFRAVFFCKNPSPPPAGFGYLNPVE